MKKVKPASMFSLNGEKVFLVAEDDGFDGIDIVVYDNKGNLTSCIFSIDKHGYQRYPHVEKGVFPLNSEGQIKRSEGGF